MLSWKMNGEYVSNIYVISTITTTSSSNQTQSNQLENDIEDNQILYKYKAW